MAVSSSTQVPLWVPLVVAAVGFLGVLGAQVIASWRDERRLERESQREDLQWKRDRRRERDMRSYEGRQQAYAEVIGAVESFDWLMFPAYNATRLGYPVTDDMLNDVRTGRDEVRMALGMVNLHAPERIRGMVREVMITRSTLAMRMLRSGAESEDSEQLWRRGQRAYQELRAEMREDLDIEMDALPYSDATDAVSPA